MKIYFGRPGRTQVFKRHDYFAELGKPIIINLSFQGHYNENSWAKIEALTTEEILDTINHKNVSGILLKVSFVVVVVVVVVICVVVVVLLQLS